MPICVDINPEKRPKEKVIRAVKNNEAIAFRRNGIDPKLRPKEKL